MHGVHAFQRDVNRAIDRRPGAREYSHHAKGMILVQRKGHVAGAMRDDDLLAEAIIQRGRDIRAKDRAIRIGEALALDQLELAVLAKPEVIEIILRRAKHVESAVRITQRKGNRPRDFRQGGDPLVALPAHVVGGVADPEHR